MRKNFETTVYTFKTSSIYYMVSVCICVQMSNRVNSFAVKQYLHCFRLVVCLRQSTVTVGVHAFNIFRKQALISPFVVLKLNRAWYRIHLNFNEY